MKLGSVLALVILVAQTAAAEVVETSATSLQVRHVLNVAASPEKSWKSILDIGHWWSSDHTWSGDSANLRLEPRAGGCFCETLPGGGGAQHMTVIFFAPNQRLTMIGGLGPLQSSGVAGALTFQLTPRGTGTEIAVVYNVGGYFHGGLASIATGVDGVLGLQVARLQRLIESGDPEEKKVGK